MASEHSVFWTEEAIRNLNEILEYLTLKWTHKEIQNFKIKLAKQIKLLQRNPRLFPVSNYQPRLRKAVLSKQTIIFYEIKSGSIYIAYLFIANKTSKN